ncbi:AraC family transcriptional regulator [Flavobacterium sp. WV_118_3]|uniref:helix-turn-helix domain-containing protein n=1 Tax=Flavobacterium sp. WV_118_3 TaxID=3151764 RepID=UPI002CF7B6D5|nr:AraC family transcriptional regulator [Flavobacterium sp.]
MTKLPLKYSNRKEEITLEFINQVDRHIDSILEGHSDVMFEIKDIASIMCIHPVHLSTTIKLQTGKSPCYFFEKRIMDESKRLLSIPDKTIAEIATLLTFDPSNFTKFFKRFEKITPSQYRNSLKPAIQD